MVWGNNDQMAEVQSGVRACEGGGPILNNLQHKQVRVEA